MTPPVKKACSLISRASMRALAEREPDTSVDWYWAEAFEIEQNAISKPKKRQEAGCGYFIQIGLEVEMDHWPIRTLFWGLIYC
ncbi:hypothetical protein BWI93_03965 [Siphonobacter sp. BAB-5385]|nr:hypothetical protein BWI93_03965 [Siphonobacter sp. BAB-5385]